MQYNWKMVKIKASRDTNFVSVTPKGQLSLPPAVTEKLACDYVHFHVDKERGALAVAPAKQGDEFTYKMAKAKKSGQRQHIYVKNMLKKIGVGDWIYGRKLPHQWNGAGWLILDISGAGQ